MFTVDELLSKRNQNNAFLHLSTKKEGKGPDGMRLSELSDYWKINHERIEKEIREGIYQPGIIKNYEILQGAGKRRIISGINVLDRFITRLLSQKLKRYFEPEFLENSYAYQEGKGTLEAITKAKEYVEAGNTFVAEVDIKDFFDSIPLDAVMQLLKQRISDGAVIELLHKYLYCRIDMDGRITEKRIGLLQGNSISPILSNMYLHALDTYMEGQNYHWIRFADNIYLFAGSLESASEIYEDIVAQISSDFGLKINDHKSGVHDALNKAILGYDLYRAKGKIDVRKHKYQLSDTYHNWHAGVVQKINQEYHILQDGILNRKDYTLLFENEEERHYIPVEVVEQLNVYSEVSMSYGALKTLGEQNIKVSFLDKYGNLMGNYIPERCHSNAVTMLKQCQLYSDNSRHLNLAKQMEIAGLHNMRANLRYYQKKGKSVDEHIAVLSQCIKEINEQKEIGALMLLEARARQKYYAAFNLILEHTGFMFLNRTKRPPKDPLNAMISFGNTLLYNQFLQMIWKTSLNPQIGVVHAANRRGYSLNLDFADIFKPVIVDRVIFTLLNCQQLKKEEHFEKAEEGGIFLNKQGKRIFLEEFGKKLDSLFVYKGKKLSYRQLMREEILQFQKYVLSDEKYRPYKYY